MDKEIKWLFFPKVKKFLKDTYKSYKIIPENNDEMREKIKNRDEWESHFNLIKGRLGWNQ